VLLPHKAKETLPILNSMNAMAVVQDNCPPQWAYDWSWQECSYFSVYGMGCYRCMQSSNAL